MRSRSNHALRRAARHAPRVLASALDLALIGALALAAAYCTWVWFAPRARAAPALALESRAQDGPSAAARQLFAAAAPQAASTSSVRLIGVLAPGRALFIPENGRPRSAAVGETVGGLELLEVHPDYVIMSRAGSRERISLVRGNASR